jgi:hypothetical protein
MTDSDLNRGAAEDNSGVPVTPTDVEASKTPPSEGGGHADEVPDDPGESVRSAAGHGGSDASGTAR